MTWRICASTLFHRLCSILAELIW